ncbi:UNVERIFIED_CONTAM: hypothetical protein GTU68_010986 [Idotea baltica]|nr:hypothetical protein [Idotea baltica]
MQNRLTLLAQQVGEKLSDLQQKVTTAESCTAGGIAEVITRVAGSSNWFEVGYITYSNHQKTNVLNVDATILRQKGAVSQAVAEQMAQSALKQSGADYSVAVSGIAGPDGGSVEKPVGTVWCAWSCATETVSTQYLFSGDRIAVREQTIEAALLGILLQLNDRKLNKRLDVRNNK